MDKETVGTVRSVATQWWLKVNTKPVRMGPLDGATFPHIIKVEYTVEGKTYTRRKWIGAGRPVPAVGSEVTVLYSSEKPGKGMILLSAGSRIDGTESPENTKKRLNMFYYSAAMFYLASIITFVAGNRNSMGFVWLLLGSVFLCLGSVNSINRKG